MNLEAYNWIEHFSSCHFDRREKSILCHEFTKNELDISLLLNKTRG